MNDLNFFELYNGKNKNKIDKDLIFYAIVLILTICVLIYAVANVIKVKKLNSEIFYLIEQIEIKKTDSRINKILSKEEEIRVFDQEFKKLKAVDEHVTTMDVINEDLLNAINIRVPETSFLKSIYINGSSVTIEGVALNKKTISDFEYKLAEVKYFDEIFIPAIYNENEYYGFTVNVKLKDVKDYGEQNIN